MWDKFFIHPKLKAWWRHQMETFSALLAICAGNSPVPGEFPTQRPVTRSFDVYFDLSPSKRLSKHSWGWWSETPSSSLWRHRNGVAPLRFRNWQVISPRFIIDVIVHPCWYWNQFMFRKWVPNDYIGNGQTNRENSRDTSRVNSLRPSDAYIRWVSNHQWFR